MVRINKEITGTGGSGNPLELPSIDITTTPYLIGNDYGYIKFDTTSGNIVTTLPDAIDFIDKQQLGMLHYIRGGTNTVTINTKSGDVIKDFLGNTYTQITLDDENDEVYLKSLNSGTWTIKGGTLSLS